MTKLQNTAFDDARVVVHGGLALAGQLFGGRAADVDAWQRCLGGDLSGHFDENRSDCAFSNLKSF